MNYTDLNKDESIKRLVRHLADKFGKDKFKIMDYWVGDLRAIGLADISRNKLMYISTFNRANNFFYVSLENTMQGEPEFPYEHAGDFEYVDLNQLEDLFIGHFRIKMTDAQQ